MLYLYAPRPGDAEAATAALEPGYIVDQKEGWTSFRRSAPGSECAVPIVRRTRSDNFVGRLATFRDRFPFQPLVLVTRRNAGNVRRTRRISLDEIVWLRNVEQGLAKAIERSKANTFFRHLSRRLDESENVPGKLRRALVLACRCEQPVRSVTRLAEAVGCDRRTLWRQWRQTTSEAHLKDLLAWMQLLQAVGERARGQSVTAVAQKLGLSEKTFGPLSKRLTNRTFAELADRGMADLVTAFRDEFAGAMLDRIPGRDVFR